MQRHLYIYMQQRAGFLNLFILFSAYAGIMTFALVICFTSYLYTELGFRNYWNPQVHFDKQFPSDKRHFFPLHPYHKLYLSVAWHRTAGGDKLKISLLLLDSCSYFFTLPKHDYYCKISGMPIYLKWTRGSMSGSCPFIFKLANTSGLG